MLHKLKVKDYPGAELLFTRRESNPGIRSVFSLNSEALVLADRGKNPDAVCIITSLLEYFSQTLIPQAIRSGVNREFAFYPDSPR